jgi:DNA polymerase-3 subunit alpha
MPAFIHLECYSEYSIEYGLLQVDSWLAHAVAQQMPAIALTDRMNLCAMVKFVQAALSLGIKPIIGSKLILQDNSELLVFCKNRQGYLNLVQLLSKAYLENSGKVAHIWLAAHHEGLIALAPYASSNFTAALYAGKAEQLQQSIAAWQQIFADDFYISISRIQKDSEVHQALLLDLARRYSWGVVASNQVCFLHADDYEAHTAKVCVHAGKLLSDAAIYQQYTAAQYLRSTADMCQLFADIPEVLQNSVAIAEQCNFQLTLGTIFLPKYQVTSGSTVEQVLEEQALAGLSEKKLLAAQYMARLNMEISIIKRMGFASYFLIVADFIRWAKQHDIPVGPGRGSGAGSLVAYVLGITGLDPLVYDLLFERFLNPERVSLPDFDIDFCMEGRDRVIHYVTKKYGAQSVAQIMTFGSMAAKAVVRDVGRVLGHPYGFVDKLAKLIPFELGITLDKALCDVEELKKRYEQEEEVKLLFELAGKLEGSIRNFGKHAGGVVIAPSDLTNFVPLYADSAHPDQAITQLDKDDLEAIGLIKFDFLGLRTLTILHETIRSLQPATVDLEGLPLDDEQTFELLRSGKTAGVFQLESRGMQELIIKLEPNCLEDIIALVALFRPGPLQSGMVDDFINRKKGKDKISYLHPLLEPILRTTYGIILYQEQVMQIAQVMAGYTLGAADLLRKAMGKKKPEEMAKQRDIFLAGAAKSGIATKAAEHVFELMAKFAGYGFNKSHSAAYGLITYQTAWFKAHYPGQFMAAVLSADLANTDKIVLFLEEARQMGLTIVPPHINHSAYRFVYIGEAQIIYGLGAIKGLGEGVVTMLVEERLARGKYRNLFDICRRVDLKKMNKRVFEALIYSGALDGLAEHRAALMAELPEALHAAEQVCKNRQSGQLDLFGDYVDTIVEASAVTSVGRWNKNLELQKEKEILGLYLSGHPIEQHQKELRGMQVTPLVQVLGMQPAKALRVAGFMMQNRVIQTKKGNKMLFFTLDDRSGRIEVSVFSDLYQQILPWINKTVLLVIEGDTSVDQYTGNVKLIAKQVYDLDSARRQFVRQIHLELLGDCPAETELAKLQDFLAKQPKGQASVVLHYQRGDEPITVYLEHSRQLNADSILLAAISEFYEQHPQRFKIHFEYDV